MAQPEAYCDLCGHPLEVQENAQMCRQCGWHSVTLSADHPSAEVTLDGRNHVSVRVHDNVTAQEFRQVLYGERDRSLIREQWLWFVGTAAMMLAVIDWVPIPIALSILGLVNAMRIPARLSTRVVWSFIGLTVLCLIVLALHYLPGLGR